MASNPTPDNNDVLRALSDGIADGCHALEVTLGIKQYTEASIRAAIAGLKEAEQEVGKKKKALNDAEVALRAADDAGTTCITNCRLRLAQAYGQRWSPDWEPTGFPTGSTAVPKTEDERFTLLDDLKDFFTDNPTLENEGMGATAALCGAAWTAISDRRQDVATATSAMTTAFNNRTAAAKILRRRVRGLINELGDLIAEDDPRWEDFGLNIPANPSPPEPVESVTLTALGNGKISVEWPYAVRAERYKVQTLRVGVDSEFQTAVSSSDLEAMLKDFTVGQVLKVQVIAANDGGDASPSPEAEITVT